MWKDLREFFLRYERYVSPVTLVIGFITDNILLRRIDVFFSNFLLISYLSVAAVAIIALNVSVNKRETVNEQVTLHFVLVFLMQFCLGGLFSASFLFYSKSGSLVTSWPFLLLILFYMIGNELMRKNYMVLGFQISAFFSALFSYLIFFVPIILGKMDDSIFLLSGIASLMITGLFIYVTSWFVPVRIRRSLPILTGTILGIFALINVLYFTNLIPPIPLSLKEVGIYRSITKTADGLYILTGEEHSWFSNFVARYDVSYVPGQPLYAWSSIFAPKNLVTDVVHLWQYYDPEKGQWKTMAEVHLSIVGGRDNGFRTYSTMESIFPGHWRVNVETPRGQVIGRITFNIIPATGKESLESLVK